MYPVDGDEDLSLLTHATQSGEPTDALARAVYLRVQRHIEREESGRGDSDSDDDIPTPAELFRRPANPPAASEASPAGLSTVDAALGEMHRKQQERVLDPLSGRDAKRGKRKKGVSEASSGRDLIGSEIADNEAATASGQKVPTKTPRCRHCRQPKHNISTCSKLGRAKLPEILGEQHVSGSFTSGSESDQVCLCFSQRPRSEDKEPANRSGSFGTRETKS
jgi:hypothetical protein